MAPASTGYLIAYNIVQAAGWALILYNSILHIAQHPQSPFVGIYGANAGLLRTGSACDKRMLIKPAPQVASNLQHF